MFLRLSSDRFQAGKFIVFPGQRASVFVLRVGLSSGRCLATHSKLQTLGTEAFFWDWQGTRSAMSPNSVSAVLEKLIGHLCLGDFPCRSNTKVRVNYQCLFSTGQLRCARWGQTIALSRDREKTAQKESRRRRLGPSWSCWDVLTLRGTRITHGALKLHPWESWLCRLLNASTPTLFTPSLPPSVFWKKEWVLSVFFGGAGGGVYWSELESVVLWCGATGNTNVDFQDWTPVLKPLLFQECTSISSS